MAHTGVRWRVEGAQGDRIEGSIRNGDPSPSRMQLTPLYTFLLAALGAGTLPAQEGLPIQPRPALGPPPQAAVTDTRPLLHHQLVQDRGSASSWRIWWSFNQAPYLDLRERVRAPRASGQTGPGEGVLQPELWAPAAEEANGPTHAQKEHLIRPSLLRLAEASTNRNVHAQVAVALARLGLFPRETAVQVRSYLASPSLEIAQAGALALGVIGEQSSNEELVALLLDDSTGRWLCARPDGVPLSVRSFAAYGLGLIAAGLDADPRLENSGFLWKVVDDPASALDLQLAATLALGLQSPADPRAMVERLYALVLDEARDDRVRAQAITAMARCLTGLAPENPITLEARRNLAHLVHPRQPALLRQSALQALGVLAYGDQEEGETDLALLVDQIQHGQTPMERHLAAMSLAYLGASAVINLPVREQVVDTLILGLADPSSEHRAWCGLALGVLSSRAVGWHGKVHTDVDQALSRALRAPGSAEERSAYAIAIGLSGHRSEAGALLKLAQEQSDPLLVGHTAVALGLLGESEALEELLGLLDASIHQPQLLEQVATGLALIGSEQTVPVLLNHFDPAFGPSPTFGTLAALTRALGMAGDARTAPSLINAMENRHASPTAKALAAQALGLVADKESLPWQYRLAADLNYLARSESLLDPVFGTGILDRR